VVESPIDTHPHPSFGDIHFEVNVRCTFLDGIEQDEVDELRYWRTLCALQ
jgi:hypothetical protein